MKRITSGMVFRFCSTMTRRDVVVAVIGAVAQRLDLRRRRIVAAEREGEHLLDQAGAGAAGRRRLGVGAHVVEREQLLVLDRLDDRALADAVAAADLGARRPWRRPSSGR